MDEYEACTACQGKGLTLNQAGEPDDCHECHGDTVVKID